MNENEVKAELEKRRKQREQEATDKQIFFMLKVLVFVGVMALLFYYGYFVTGG